MRDNLTADQLETAARVIKEAIVDASRENRLCVASQGDPDRSIKAGEPHVGCSYGQARVALAVSGFDKHSAQLVLNRLIEWGEDSIIDINDDAFDASASASKDAEGLLFCFAHCDCGCGFKIARRPVSKDAVPKLLKFVDECTSVLEG